MNKFVSAFVSVLDELLEEKGTNIKLFAPEIKTHADVLYAYKRDNYLPSIPTAMKIANYFDCSLNYLMGIDEDKKNSKFTNSYDISKFYPRYEALLNKEGIKHFSLCKKIDLNVSSLKNWKDGKPPKMEPLIKIAQYFGVSIDYLIGRSDSY